MLVPTLGKPGRVESDPNPCAATRLVEERDLPAMFLDNFLDDRETETGSPHPCGDVRLHQPFAVIRKPGAGVDHINHHLLALIMKAHFDTISAEMVFPTGKP